MFEAPSLSFLGVKRHRWVKSAEGLQMAGKQMKLHMLTRNPFRDSCSHVDLFLKGINQVEKRFPCILRHTLSIQGFTKTLSNRDVEVIKFPSGYLSIS